MSFILFISIQILRRTAHVQSIILTCTPHSWEINCPWAARACSAASRLLIS